MTTGRRHGGSSGEEELLSRLYQQLTDQQAARLGGGYDLAAGLERYQAWLRERAAQDQAATEAVQAGLVMAMQARATGIGAGGAALRPGDTVTESVPGRSSADRASPISAANAGWDADRAVSALYSVHYKSLVRLAAMLLGDVPTAEDLVQDSFVALHTAWRRLADGDRALSYLRQSVVYRCRAAQRQRLVTHKAAPGITPGIPAAVPEQATLAGHSAIISALQTLPARQREVLVLRYYADLPEAQIATTMGISTSAVKSHMARAMSSLQAELCRTND
jgi:RNA polymerase sigma-70 factor (sigma-E family)